MINIIDLKIVSEIIFKYNKVFNVIKIDKRERVDKIIKNKFSRLSI